MNMQNLMAQAQKMQKDIMKKKEELEKQEFVGKSQFVEVVLYGNKKIKSISINIENSIDADDKEMLEDLVKIAFEDALRQVDSKTEEVMGVYGNSLNGLF